MSTIEFYSGIADKLDHADRLLRKAAAKGTRVAVVGDANTLRQLDAQLWTDNARDFIAHVLVQPNAAVPKHMGRTALWLVPDVRLAPPCEVVVNLGPDAVEPQAFKRVIELVSNDADDRRAGRARWRHYESQGHMIEHKAFDAQPAGAAAMPGADASSGDAPQQS